MRTIYYSFIISLFLIIGGSVHLYGQEHGVLSGRITDKETDEPLLGANIYTKKDLSIGAVSDFNGYYSISLPPGEYTFTISFTGMKTTNRTVTIKSGEVTKLNVKITGG